MHNMLEVVRLPRRMLRVSCVGFVPASSGTAILYGHDLHTDIAAVRATVAVCPQEPVLYRFLTVEEHLRLFGTVSVLLMCSAPTIPLRLCKNPYQVFPTKFIHGWHMPMAVPRYANTAFELHRGCNLNKRLKALLHVPYTQLKLCFCRETRKGRLNSIN